MSPAPRRPSATPHRRLLATAALLLGSSLLTGCQAVLFGSLNATTGKTDVVVQRDVTYDPAHQLALDVYRLPGTARAPVVVFFYGGSWKSGKRQWYRWAAEALAKRGLVVVVPDYRKWPQVRLDGFMQDAARAVAWTHAHASDYGGDPASLFVMGHSAGAHIGALLATDAHWLNAVGMQPRQLAGFIGLAGPYDFLPLKDPDFIDMFGTTHDAQLRSQPMYFVNGDEPPMLLMQGSTDKIVWPRNAESLARALRKENEPVEVKLYPDIGHFAILFSISKPLRDKAPVIQDVVQFIHEHPRATSVAAPAEASAP
ncbi:alpha/beta hydrolase [Rhodanobacter sp. C03]|uniref:alpha/beta hydrolase n=1 Tax=Rhodanobacter sp. C03 TaxID=1945858 RepID=UPI000986AC70|nr:alpha/beta hydrolase [Rhodanobacter sp. C03]OOG59861.1 alpha/beta hydrolase [Rhodanobacter sp. C03]